MTTEIRIEEDNAPVNQTAAPQPEAQDWADEAAASEETETEAGEARKSKKLISLRLPQEDLAEAKALAEELKIGYQTLLCQIIHEGLAHRAAQQRVLKLAETIRGTVPGLTPEELANTPAVKAAQELLNSPALKNAQELVSSPVVKLAQDVAANPQVKAAQEFANTTATKAKADLDKAASEFNALPAVQALNATSAKLLQDFTASPAFKAAEEMVASLKVGKAAEAAKPAEKSSAISSEEFQQLANAVEDIKRALKNTAML